MSFTFSQAKVVLDNKKCVTIHPNVVLIDCGDTVKLTHYGQTVGVYDKSDNGFFLVAPDYLVGGKLSNTTIKIINKFCPSLMRVSSSKRGTYLFKNGVKLQTLKLQ